MTHLESSAWTLTGGSACVFLVAVVLRHASWQIALAALAVAVVAWAWQGPIPAGAALGVIAWLCVTGFDVHLLGRITVSGPDDAGRAALLVLGGMTAASAHALIDAVRRRRPAEDAMAAAPAEDAIPAALAVPPPREAAIERPAVARSTEARRHG
jgi:hypothetical protein